MMLRPIPILMAVVMAMVSLGRICAQQDPPPLVMPHVGGDRFETNRETAVVKDQTINYANRHEAVLAAFQAGYKASVVEHKDERAMRLLLLALRRDPQFAPALFDLAVVCARATRWHDAILFLGEAQKQAAPDSEIAKVSAAELKRIEAIERLESTPEGRKRRQFDIEFVKALQKEKDPFVALGLLKQVSKIDVARWEAPALAGVIHAELGQFSESEADLEAAAAHADKVRAAQLKKAAAVAHRESEFKKDKDKADGLSEKQHDEAAVGYAKAWVESPAHWDIALEAVTEYLLDDQIDPAVPLLSKMRDSAPPELRVKALAMLNALGAISADAKTAAERAASADEPQPAETAAASIRKLVGQLTNPGMDLVTKPEPLLIEDKTAIMQVPDDDIAGGKSDLALLSTDSVFALYQKNLAAEAVPSGAVPEQTHPETPAGPASAAPPDAGSLRPLSPAERAATPAASVGASSKGAAQPVAIRSTPPGATVLLDETEKCVTPCEPPLAPGRHTLLAKLAGYRDFFQILNVEKGKASAFDLALDPKRGSVKVVTEIPGAPIFLDGKETGKRTPAVLPLNEGTYEVGVEVDGVRRVKKVEITDYYLGVLTF
jgi:tetratricopeptide (TPR) repeat protein